MKITNGLLRSISALFGLALFISSLYYGGWYYLAVFTVIWGIGLYEFYWLFQRQGYRPPVVGGLVLGIGSFVASFYVAQGTLNPIWLLVIIASSFLAATTQILPRSKPNTTVKITDIAIMIFGVVYVPLSGGMAHLLLFPTNNTPLTPTYYPYTFLGLCILVWSYDTFAYIFGRTIGRRKFFPHISPKKTWEGLFGGIIGTCGAAIAVYHYIDPTFSLSQWLLIGFATAGTCTAGDAIESMIKRDAQAKDSGRIIPGHGGVLDRFDGLLCTVAINALWISALPPQGVR